ncbi:MAG: hypothetical protein CMB80_21685 [Flammeovirgaceae bacterium]|nr:hypothetical protein [Flammeovirgaceae bacterium]MBR11323.1 hypothetical protein [Rickettsiales bacterium]HCX21565.1 hypothetical protein [Cytophagales bacterium]|tara:strand:+ start:6147 stop:8468 length:2322 start_codon:yes stop_codon:yes gene_type:complete
MRPQQITRWIWRPINAIKKKILYTLESIENSKRLLVKVVFMTMCLWSFSPGYGQNYSLEFDGIDDKISVSTLGTSSSFTAEMWVYKPEDKSGFVTLLDFNDDKPWIGVNSNIFAVWSSFTYSSSSTHKTSGWTHFAATYDGTTLTLYEDGIEVYQDNVSVTTGNTGMTIGFSTGDLYFKGRIDELRIWDDVRTESEIQDNLFVTLTGSESNLVAYYDFNEGTGTTLTDATSNNHDGTITNFASSAWVHGAPVDLNIWNGSTWSDGTPSSSSDVRFDEDYDFSLGGLSVNSAFIVDTAVVSVEDTYLEIKEAIQNDGTLLIESGASLMTYEDNDFMGEALIDRSTTFSTETGQYSIVGSPVQTETSDALGSLVYSYDETTEYNSSTDNPGSGNDGLDRFDVVSSGTDILPGVGYFSAFTGDIRFEGVPNAGDISQDLSFTDHDATDLTDENNYEGFNLVANPYPSAIKLSSFVNGNTDIAGSIYLWDDGGSSTRRTNSDYIVANKMGASGGSSRSGDWDGYIRSTQGFFVKSLDVSSPQVLFADSMRVLDNNTDDGFFRKTNKYPLLRIEIQGEEDFGETLLGLAPDATQDYDAQYDAFKPTKEGLMMYSLLKNQPQAIQGLPDDFEGIIPLGVQLAEAGIYQLNITANDWPQKVVLLDQQLNQEISLDETSYSFQSDAGKINDRFFLKVTNRVTESLKEPQVKVWYSQGTFYINNLINDELKLSVIAMDGKLMKEQSISPGYQQIDWSNNGIYICVLKRKNQIISTQKISTKR